MLGVFTFIEILMKIVKNFPFFWNLSYTKNIQSLHVIFQDLHLGQSLTKGLNEAGFLKPSPVQWSALPMASLGVDLVVQAKSGTGKTLVFVVSALRMVKIDVSAVQVILIAPTREIGLFNFSIKIKIYLE